MARPSRNQRRERRAQQPALAGAGAQQTPAPRREEPAAPRPHSEPGGGGRNPFRFFQESYGELKKVEWPNQKAVISGTVVVIAACIIVGAFLWVNDQLWQYVVQHVLLR